MDLTLEQKLDLTENPDTSIEILEQLADDEYWGVRCWVARHPNCSLKLLEKLVDDEYWEVRSRVAQHPNCSLKLLEKLADDEHYFVRYYVAENPNCSLKLLEKLADDENEYVRCAAKGTIRKNFNPINFNTDDFLTWVENATIEELEQFGINKLTPLQKFIQKFNLFK